MFRLPNEYAAMNSDRSRTTFRTIHAISSMIRKRYVVYRYIVINRVTPSGEYAYGAQRKFRFISYGQLANLTNEWIKTLHFPIDAVIGIPRSGMLVASIIATKLGKPLVNFDEFIRYSRHNPPHSYKTMKNVFVVDENINTGKSMHRVLRLIAKNRDLKKFTIITGSLLYISGDNETAIKASVDTYYKPIRPPFLFEWSLVDIHQANNLKICFDLDGVLCENCSPEVDADEVKYRNWLSTVTPYLIPHYTIDSIISNRLEKYRKLTEEWLHRNNIKYRKLILWNIDSKTKRGNNFSKRKIDILNKIKPDIFFESSIQETMDIYIHTNIPVLCIDKMIMFS